MRFSITKDAKREVELNIYKDVVLPSRKNPTDAGLDLNSFGNYIIYPHEFKIIRTGIMFEFPENSVALLKPKSKSNYLLGAGVVDQSYRGEILVKVYNPSSKETLTIEHGQAVCQMVILPVLIPSLEYVDDISVNTDRGVDGGIYRELNKLGERLNQWKLYMNMIL